MNETDIEINTYLHLPQQEQQKINAKIKKLTASFFLLVILCCAVSILNYLLSVSERQTFRISQIGFCDEHIKNPQDLTFNVTDKMIEYQMINFIELLRSVPDSTSEMMTNFSTARRFCIGEAQSAVVRNFYDWNVSGKIKESFVSYITIENIKKNINNEFEIHWKESVWQAGKFKFEVRYYGYFIYEVQTPVYEEDLFRNPSGIYIKKYSLTKVSE